MSTTFPLPTGTRPQPRSGGVAGRLTRLVAAARPMATRRTLQVALGLIWLLDGALQLQPFMFGRGFATQVLAPAATGQPGFVADSVRWASRLVLAQPTVLNALFAAVQLLIGAGLLFGRTVRPALALSFAWAFSVWFLGEGLGGLAAGSSTLLTGAPGGVILYAVIGLAAWPVAADPPSVHATPGARDTWLVRARRLVRPGGDDSRPARWTPIAWTVVWCGFAVLQALPANASARAVAGVLRANGASSPGWLDRADAALASWVHGTGGAVVPALVVAEVAIGLLALLPGTGRRIAAWAGIALSLGVWVLAQGFGYLTSGSSTDPNAGLLLALFGVALLGTAYGPIGARGDFRQIVARSHPDRVPAS